uniref:Sulfotransferase domain-containing protein n=1 Tax=Alexandrium andersonii TaxID=327968 RepID=A0A7S2E102_9DINO
MLADLRPCVEKVVAHLGLGLQASDIDELLPTFDFGHMKANADQFQPVSVSWKEGFQFLRKGTKGDASVLYGPAECDAYARAFAERFADGPPAWAPYTVPAAKAEPTGAA